MLVVSLLAVFAQTITAFVPISYDLTKVESTSVAKRDAVDVTIQHIPDIHIIQLNVGSNNDPVAMILDILTPDTLFFAFDQKNWDFNYSDSSTFKRNTSAPPLVLDHYYNDTFTGFWGLDDVTIGNNTVKGLDFGVVPNNWLYNSLGLGLPEWELSSSNSSSPYVYDTFLNKLKKQGLIKKSAYSISFASSSTTLGNGTLLFGAVDHARYSGNLTTLPMVDYDAYGVYSPDNTYSDQKLNIQVLLNGIRFTNGKKGTETITGRTFPAAIAPSWATYVPKYVYESLKVALGSYDSGDDSAEQYLSCPNNEHIALQFDFSGTTVSVPLSAFLHPGTADCTFNVKPLPDDSDYIILGQEILDYVYLVVDTEAREISLAQVKVAKESNIEEIVSQVPSAVRGSTETSFTTNTAVAEAHKLTYNTASPKKMPRNRYTNNSESKRISMTWLMVLGGAISTLLIL